MHEVQLHTMIPHPLDFAQEVWFWELKGNNTFPFPFLAAHAPLVLQGTLVFIPKQSKMNIVYDYTQSRMLKVFDVLCFHSHPAPLNNINFAG